MIKVRLVTEPFKHIIAVVRWVFRNVIQGRSNKGHMRRGLELLSRLSQLRDELYGEQKGSDHVDAESAFSAVDQLVAACTNARVVDEDVQPRQRCRLIHKLLDRRCRGEIEFPDLDDLGVAFCGTLDFRFGFFASSFAAAGKDDLVGPEADDVLDYLFAESAVGASDDHSLGLKGRRGLGNLEN